SACCKTTGTTRWPRAPIRPSLSNSSVSRVPSSSSRSPIPHLVRPPKIGHAGKEADEVGPASFAQRAEGERGPSGERARRPGKGRLGDSRSDPSRGESMPEFPRSPVSPAELIEKYLPAAFAATARPEPAAGVTLALGVQLVGADGGEWVFDLRGGDVIVRPGSRADAAFSYVQTVEDWRGALWEGRGGAVGRGAAALFRPGAPEVEAGIG